ncbi:hypothetical protein IFM89_007421 [Coptis chinensis]|uniref:Uncharacterized protein n=1 Tax=Coptis chinensis TaxID=261450 RepID=A0A835M8X1_9MAGN|nr:hypothetical protein IFM89_007421 [Coptis chinensis]
MQLFVERWDDLVGEMSMKISYPALEEEWWKIVIGSDPKNTPWSYHNGGSWPGCLGKVTGARMGSIMVPLIEEEWDDNNVVFQK